MALVSAVHAWDWDANTCTVVFGGRTVNAPLPPFSAPYAAYPGAQLEGDVVRAWGAPTLAADPAAVVAERLDGELLMAARAFLSLQPSAPIEEVLAVAQKRDVQGDVLSGILDGLGLTDEQRLALAANHETFGRHRRRCFKPPHAVVFQRHDDALCGNFSRSESPNLRALSAAVPAWLAVRNARFAGFAPDRALVEESFGSEVADILARHTDAFTLSPKPPPASPSVWASSFTIETDKPGLDGDAFAHCFSLKDPLVYFAPCVASALPHPRTEAFRRARANAAVNSFAVHETEGALFITSLAKDECRASDGRAVSRGGAVFLAHPSAAEGGWQLFAPHGLRRVGLYCPLKSGLTWRPDSVRAVLSRLAPGGTVHTNSLDKLFIAV